MTDLHLRRRLCMDDQVGAGDVLGPSRTEDVVLKTCLVEAITALLPGIKIVPGHQSACSYTRY